MDVRPQMQGVSTPPHQFDRFFCNDFITNRFDTETADVGISLDSMASITEGNSGTTDVTLNVFLSQTRTVPVSVCYRTGDGDATAADADYLASSGVVTFLPGLTNQTITVKVVGDTKVEWDEHFYVELFQPTHAYLANWMSMVFIRTDDVVPTLSITDVATREGDWGQRAAVFTVSLSPPVSQEVTVEFATADGTAQAKQDYHENRGTIRFAPGTTTQTIAVRANGDTLVESDETFFVNLDSTANASLWKGQAAGTLINDDQAAALQIVKTLDRAAARPGELVRFTIAAQNVGGASATGVTVRDILPSGLMFQSATVPAGGVFDTNRLEWTVGQLAPAATVEMQLTAQVASVAELARLFGMTNAPGANPPPLILADVFGSVTNRATIGANEVPPEAQMTATAVVRLVPPSLASSVAGKSDGTFEFSVPAGLDAVLLVQASDDMVTWVTVGVIDPRTGETKFTEFGVEAHRSRFYRIVPQ